ncbi:MAG: glycoside hydrolase family 65 protein [Candidatus Omnitrophica bacterium]|nr:glycoside hydrolase family 65 protein [Candidatus Omnitrophota bacterium]
MKEIFSKYTAGDLWCVKEDGFDKEIQDIRETQFALGNGLLGTRGVLEEIPQGAMPGTYIAGVFDRFTSQVSELVNFPNPVNFKITANGEKLGAVAMDILEHKRILNMQDGLVVRRTVYSDSKKRRYDYQSMRFMSMHDKNLMIMRIVLTPLDQDVKLEVQTDIDTGVHNRGVLTEGRKRHFVVRDLEREDNANYRVIDTLEKTNRVIYRNGFYYKIGNKKIYARDNFVRLKLKKKQSVVFTVVYHISVMGQGESEFKKNKKKSQIEFQKAYRGHFESLFKKHIQQWRKLWEIADVIIEGTADIQKNVRFNIYHMLICAHDDQGFSSIGARTLSGEGYRGHIFWDAEIFLLPFYAYVMPDVAKNMLMYRHKRIQQAKIIAKEKGYEGAMFPWESAGTGEEETPSWAKNLDGEVIPIRTNDLEHHIAADIAYAIVQYFQVADDKEFMKDQGYEMIFEIARFWASRTVRNRRGRYEIRNVIGPDEFHEDVNNNAYTNVMAKWCLLTAYKYYNTLKKSNRRLFDKLVKTTSLAEKEVKKWKYIAPRIDIKIREDNVIEEFDGFFKKKMIDLVKFDENNIPSLPDGIKVKDYNKTQLVKQADVLMCLFLLSDIFNKKTKESNFWYYYSRTLHKSSLSVSMHALIALEVGAVSQAYQFFNVALRADISNLHGNTPEGIHAASLGGVWQDVIHGFAGVRGLNGLLRVNPRVPGTWRKMKFALFWKKDILRFEVKNNEVRIKCESRNKKKVKIQVFGKTHLLSPAKEHIFRRKEKLVEAGYY